MAGVESIRRRSYVGHRRMQEAARLDHNHLWHPFTQQRDWVDEEPLMIESAEGVGADRQRGTTLSGRRLVAVVQRPRAPASGDRRGGARPARPGRPLDHAGPLPPRGGRARRAARGDHARRPEPGLLLGLRLDGRRGRPEDGLPVLAAPRRPARPEDLIHLPGGGLPRGHDRLGLRRGDGPLPLRLRPAPVRGSPCASRRHRRAGAPARDARGGDRRRRDRAAGAGRRRDDHPPARLPARDPRALRQARGAADLRRGRDGLRPHRDDVRVRAGGRLPRPALRREGPDRRLHAARRHARDRARSTRHSWAPTRSSRPSSTATPTRATRWPAPRRSPRSRSSSGSGRWSGSSPRSGCSRSGSRRWSARCPRSRRSASAA